jgi:hypothetical protein
MPRRKAIDNDALFKELISDYFPEFVVFANPELFEAIDWSKGFEFLEQEMINALKGRFRQKNKRRFTDKLVKVYLKSGEILFIFVHIEIQHKPEENFPERMLEYRYFIKMKYGQDDVSAYAVFTGDPPDESKLHYEKDTFGTSMKYHYTNLIAAKMDEAALIAMKQNAVALALLAAKYAYESKGNPTLRLQYKNKLADLIQAAGIDVDKFWKLIIFVKDFVNLPRTYELDFLRHQESLIFSTEEKMTISEGTKEMATRFYERAYGYNPLDEKKKAQALERKLEEEHARAEEERFRAEEGHARAEEERLRAEEEHARAEEERLRAEEERLRAEEEKHQRHQIILNMYHHAKMEVAQIVLVTGVEEKEILGILAYAKQAKDDSSDLSFYHIRI